ncbi:MAG TPA: OsmC family peroxiredoxin [Candidatus Poseidoniales archaeon]|jgi:putative redox protein|nr:MAG: peroxiredoxin [Euryarchaeota archaeon]HIG34538.1 OsmC family peroxiredoxin [Candidatus Poseidoniales archaeon]HIL67940.1 OsmC family peroxiredoxin [Candidatus Poseidoniales archaeon]
MKPTLQGGELGREGMNGEVVWTEAAGYIGTTDRGKRFGIYGSDSPSPMEMVLHGHAACSLIDVIDGLKHRRENVEFIKIEIEADRADQTPKVFTSIRMRYIVKGDVPETLVKRLIESSHDKYCSVGIMITRSGASLEWSLEMES